MPEAKSVITTFLEQELGIDTQQIDGGSLLVSDGIIDSFALMSLVTFVEETFGIRVGLLDINLANFDSLDQMQRYIDKRTGVGT
jgi:acyl carrier protein